MKPNMHKFADRIGQLLSLGVLFGAFVAGPSIGQTTEHQVKAKAMFAERCKAAGEKIYKTVENVGEAYLLKLRPSDINYEDQFKLDDPYGRDLGGTAYIETFIRGQYAATHVINPAVDLPERPKGYLYVQAQDPKDGQQYRYTGAVKAVRKKDATAPNVQLELQRNPNYDLNIYEFVLEKTPAPGATPRYGVTYDDISTREEREYWIAGSSLKVIDLQTNEVIAERIGYMMDWAQGSRAGGRSPWLFAADQACPKFADRHGASAQPYQTVRFLEKVLKPIK